MTLIIDEVIDIIDQNRRAHEELRGTSGRGSEFEDGYIQAHKDIEATFYEVLKVIELEDP